jgi:hypothetical protein
VTEKPKEDWQELMTWALEGPRYDCHGFDLSNAEALTSLHKLLIETAKELWRRDNPTRIRMPKGLEEALRLGFFEVKEGSTALPIKYMAHAPPQPPLPGMDDDEDSGALSSVIAKLPRAASLIVSAVAAANSDEHLPEDLPRSVVPLLVALRATLRPDESVSVQTPETSEKVAVRLDTEQKFAKIAIEPWEDYASLAGTVTAASLKGRATLLTDDGEHVAIVFSAEQERLVTKALHEHDRVVLRVKGRGMFEPPRGRLKKLTRVDEIELLDFGASGFDESAQFSTLFGDGGTLSDADWSSVPKDGAENIDAYLNSAHKRGGTS